MRRFCGIFAGIAAVAAALAPAAAPVNNFRFAIAGDRTGGPVPGVYERIWAEIGRSKPDFVINVGDTIEGTRDDTAEAEWRALRRIWDKYGLVQYFTPGNHDIWSERSLAIYRRETGRPNFYSFDHQNAHFVVLDNSRTFDIEDAQLRFLDDDLAKHRDRSPKFIFFHKPYWIAFLKLGSGEFPLHRIARKHGVKHIVSGHAHQFMRMSRDGVLYLAVGSSGGTLKGEGFESGFFYHHVDASVKGEQVEMTVKVLDGKSFRVEEWK
jgi:3',5'-cyclic AMP phosphodiesterase CpdA